MKIIHTADIHLGSKLDSRFPTEISRERKQELRGTFKRMVERAKAEGVSVIMLCGDIFDTNKLDRPSRTDKNFFYSLVSSTPDIDFLYLKGNHDVKDDLPETIPDNLKTFSDKWTSYAYENVVISGIEIRGENASSYYSSLALDRGKLNVVMLHGQISDGAGGDINLRLLRNKNIDYLALGHIHKPSSGRLDERGEYAYCGCLEGRGFDETGEHGFIMIDTDGGKIKREFVPFAERTIHEVEVDVSGCTDAVTAYNAIKGAVTFEKKHMYRILLTGETNVEDDICGEIEGWLKGDCYFSSVKNKTTRVIDVSAYENELSLRGEFIRCVKADASLTDDDKAAIITRGLRALGGD